MYKLIKQEGQARLGEFVTQHGKIKMPAFMNVATCAAIKGGVSALDLEDLKCQVQLCNTYHLHLRPGEDVINKLGGLHKFTNWSKPILTDSGGFQVFSLAKLRKIHEEGVWFSSHIDGKKIFMGPNESIKIQHALRSTIAMAFDECIENPAEYSYAKSSIDRTTRWLERCKTEMDIEVERTGFKQMLFGINQGSTYKDLRIEHAKAISEFDLPGYAIGGLAVGEAAEEMYQTIEYVQDYLPSDRPRYLMGVGTPVNIIESVDRGVDLFDCVMPSRNARHGHLFTWQGIININNQKYMVDDNGIDQQCGCQTCKNFSRAYIRHLLKSGEMLGQRLCVMHNLYFYNTLMEKIRNALENGEFNQFKKRYIKILGERI